MTMLFAKHYPHHQPNTLLYSPRTTTTTAATKKVEKSTKYHCLEINLIAAQDLKRVGSTMRCYAVAWIDPKKKVYSRIDTFGGAYPTWNDKFLFMVDQDMLHDYSCATLKIEIYAVRSFFGDKLVGTATVLLENLINCSNHYREGMKGSFRAVQVRRPSGTPQGILNFGVTSVDQFSYDVLMKKGSPPGYDDSRNYHSTTREFAMWTAVGE